MKVPHSEGVANHAGPESCACVREDRREALTGEGAGQVIEPRNARHPECRRRVGARKATSGESSSQDASGLCGVQDPVHVPKLLTREPGDLPFDLRRWPEGPYWELERGSQ